MLMSGNISKKITSYLLIAAMTVSWIFSIFGIFGFTTLYYMGVASSYFMTYMALEGIYPFGLNNVIQSKFIWFIIGILSYCVINPIISSDTILFWFPTNSTLWAFLPFIVPALILKKYM